MSHRLLMLSVSLILLGVACTSRPKATLETSATVIIWQRQGGIAGICQQLIISGDRIFEIKNCVNEDQMASGRLSESDWLELRAYLVEYSAFEFDLIPSEGSADMFSDSYTFFGGGPRTASEEVKAQINEFLASLTLKLINQSPSGSLFSEQRKTS